MRSGISFFDLTVYRKTFTRFWPLWAINLVFWLFVLPLNGLTQISHVQEGATAAVNSGAFRFARQVGSHAQGMGLIFALIFALAVAMAVCSHMYNNRSANFMGALPTRREGLFLSTWLAGLTMMLAPNVLIFLLTLLVEVAGHAVLWTPLLYWLAALSGMEFFFYCFAVCLGQFTGHILALPVYYGIFNAIVAAVYGLLSWVMRRYYFGFVSMGINSSDFAMWCTPVSMFFQMDLDVTNENGIWHMEVDRLWVAGVYAIVAVVLSVCALLLYRRRNLETAGDVVAVRVMRPVFKYGVAVCAGLFLGFLCDQMFSLTELGMLIAVVIWGIIGYFVAQMLLDKSIRVFKKWKGAVAVVLAFLLLFAVIGFDLTGFESRVPAAGQVESVSVRGSSLHPADGGSYLNVKLTEPDAIADVIELHEKIVEYGEGGEVNPTRSYSNWMSVSLTYELTSGQTMKRSYYIDVGPTLRGLIQTVVDHDQARRQRYNLDDVERYQANGGWLENTSFQVYAVGNHDVKLKAAWDTQQGEQLWEAVMRDFEAKRIGMHEVRIWEDEPFEETTEQMILTFQWCVERDDAAVLEMYETIGVITAPEYGYDKYTENYSSLIIEFAVTEEATETYKLLSELLMTDNRYQDNPDDNPLWRGN